MKQQLLLLDDVDGLGRSGDVVSAKPGFVRNFLLPKKKALIADKQTLKMQARLKEEREKRAAVDRQAAEKIAAELAGIVIEISVKNDPEGKMYGSVSTAEIAQLMQAKGYEIDRKNVILLRPIKTLGSHPIQLKLKEGVPATVTLEVKPELPLAEKKAKPVEPKEEETPAEETEENQA